MIMLLNISKSPLPEVESSPSHLKERKLKKNNEKNKGVKI
jgi:hypothetical protein